MKKEDFSQRLKELSKVRSKISTGMLQLTDELTKNLDENSDSGSSDGLGSASMNMKMLELQFTAAVQYFQDMEDPDKEAAEILNELAKVIDLLAMSDVVDTVSIMRQAVDQAIEYKFKHTGAEFELDQVGAMSLIKEFVSSHSSDSSNMTVKDALAALEKMEAEEKKLKPKSPIL